MTGEKNRYTTGEQLWKFNDETLSTPEHDNLVCMLLEPSVMKKMWNIYINENELTLIQKPCTEDSILYNLGNVSSYIKNDIRDLILKYYHGEVNEQEFRTYLDEHINSDLSTILSIVEERPAYLKFITEWNNRCEPYQYKWSLAPIAVEVPIMGRNSFLNGYWDVVSPLISIPKFYPISNFKYINFGYKIEHTLPSALYIEVKPIVRSFGETIRQINSYKKWDINAKDVILFTPDTKFKPQFESQGVMVITPSDIYQ